MPLPHQKRWWFPDSIKLKKFSVQQSQRRLTLDYRIFQSLKYPNVCCESPEENTTGRIFQTYLIINLLEYLLGLVFHGTNSEACCSGGSRSFSDSAPPCPAHHFSWDHKAVKGYWGRLVLSLHHLSGMFRNEYNNTEVKPIKSLVSQNKSFLHPTCYIVAGIKLQKPCTNSSSGGKNRPLAGGLHWEHLWLLWELTFTSGKTLSAAAEDQVRLTSVPQTPDTPPQLPHPTKTGQVFTVNSSRAPGPSPPFVLLWILRDQSSKLAKALFALHSENTLNSQLERRLKEGQTYPIVETLSKSKTRPKY